MEESGPEVRKRANSLQVEYVGFPEFPPEEHYRSRSVADERSFFKKWAPLWVYGTITGQSPEVAGSEQDYLEIDRALPTETMGHSLARASCYSRGGSVYARSSQGSAVPESSMTSCIMTLTKTILGSGMLGLPYLCHVNGIGLYTAMLLIFSALNAYTMYLLVWATDLAQVSTKVLADFDFGLLGAVAFGNSGLRAVQFIIGIDLWGTLVAYMVVIADIVQPAVALLITGDGMEWLSWRISVICITALFVLPLCTWKSIGALSSTAALGLLALSVFVSFILFRCITTDFTSHLQHVALIHVGMGMIRTLPMLAFVYNAHFNVFSIYNSLDRRSSSRMGLVILAACTVSTVANVLVGASGDILFQRDVKDNVLQNMRLDDAPAAAVRSLFGMALILTYPVVAFELRQMTELLVAGHRGGKMMRIVVAMVLVLSSSLTAITVPNITVAFGMVGGTTTTAMAFILPPAFFLKLYYSNTGAGKHSSGWCTLPAWVTLLFGLVAVPFFTYITLEEALA